MRKVTYKIKEPYAIFFKQKKISIKDVAESIGYSYEHVDNVLIGRYRCSEQLAKLLVKKYDPNGKLEDYFVKVS